MVREKSWNLLESWNHEFLLVSVTVKIKQNKTV